MAFEVTADELELLARLTDHEEKARIRDNEGRDQGLCPTMMRDLGQGPRQDPEVCRELSRRLLSYAADARAQGIYPCDKDLVTKEIEK